MVALKPIQLSTDNKANQSIQAGSIEILQPGAFDGFEVSELIKRCPPLDKNSVYCNLLQCDLFSSTCAIAKVGAEVVGFVSGFVKPESSDELFVWQIAVDARVRGQGVALKMLNHLLARNSLQDIKYIETTISPGNTGSERLFASLAQHLNAPIKQSLKFSKAQHFDNQHDDEVLHRIGPVST